MWAVYIRLVPVGGSLAASPGCWSQALDGTMMMFFGAPTRMVSISCCTTGFSADQRTLTSIGSLNGSKRTLLAPENLGAISVQKVFASAADVPEVALSIWW